MLCSTCTCWVDGQRFHWQVCCARVARLHVIVGIDGDLTAFVCGGEAMDGLEYLFFFRRNHIRLNP